MAKSTIKTDYSSEEIEGLIEEFSSKLETLRIRYEQYFVGAEKKPPTQLRMDVARIMRLFEQLNVTNSTNKFRIRTLTQKFTSYSTYWNRTLREIEDGTYKRHVAKAQREQERIKRAEEHKKSAPTSTVRASKGAAGVADEAEAFLASLGIASPGFDDDDMSDTPPTPVAAVTPQQARPQISPMPGTPTYLSPSTDPHQAATAYSIPQMPGAARPSVPQMPGTAQPSVPQMPAANQRPAVQPMPAANQRPAVQPMPAANQRPAVQPMPAANQRPAVQPMPAANQRPAVQPMPAATPRHPSPSTQSNPTIARQPSAQTTSAARPVVPQRTMPSGHRPSISSHQPQGSRSGIAPRVNQRVVPHTPDEKK